MSDAIVTTQAELDAALANKKVDWIEIRSERGVWLAVSATGSATVSATGSATVSATGSATVSAYDSATVSAYGSATVRATGSATVSATPYVAVHLHNASVHLTGGTVIDHTKINLSDAKTWCDYHGVEVTDGVATVFKAVNDKWTTSRRTDYTPGQIPTAPDFNRRDECGGGLHFGPTPTHALAYYPEATKFLVAKVALKDLISLTDGSVAKCKAPTVVEPLVESNIDGEVVPRG